MNDYFEEIRKMLAKDPMSTRIRFMLEDVVELRQVCQDFLKHEIIQLLRYYL